MSIHSNSAIDLNGFKLNQPKAIESTFNYLSKVYLPYAFQRLSREDYEDIANETLHLLHEKMKSTEIRNQSYVKTIAKNLAIGFIKERENMPTVSLKPGALAAFPETDAISEVFADASMAAWADSQTSQETMERFEEDVSAAISELSMSDQAFVASFIQEVKQDPDATLRMIAKKLGLTEGNLQVRLFRIRKKINASRKRP